MLYYVKFYYSTLGPSSKDYPPQHNGDRMPARASSSKEPQMPARPSFSKEPPMSARASLLTKQVS